MKQTRTVVAVCLLLAIAATEVHTRGSEAREEPASVLLAANERWRGALCRLRFPIEMRKGSNSEGWASSVVLLYSRPGEKSKYLRLWLDGREAIRDGWVPAGTAFVSHGFRLRNEKKGLILDLELAGSGARSYFEFAGANAWSLKNFKLERLDEIERVLRLNICELHSADERTVAVDGSADGGDATGQPTRTRPVEPETSLPEIEVLAAGVQPARIQRGGSVDLTVTYRVGRIPPQAMSEVVEQREIVFDGRVLKTMEERISRAAGDYTSSQSLQVPANAPVGVFELKVTVKLDGVEAGATALFEVR